MPHGAPDDSNVVRTGPPYILEDMAELAVRLGSVHAYDRRGFIMYMETFQKGLCGWTTNPQGTGSSVNLVAGASVSPPYSVRLTGGSDGNQSALISRAYPFPLLSIHGLEVAFSLSAQVDRFQVELNVTTEGSQYRAVIEYDHTNTQLEYVDSAGAWQVLDADLELFVGDDTFQALKLVVDMENGKYVRLLLNQTVYSLSGIGLLEAVSILEDHLGAVLTVYSNAGQNGYVHVDNIILTQQEV